MKTVVAALSCMGLLAVLGVSSSAFADQAVEHISKIAEKSTCASVNWSHRRGIAPKAFIRGVALVYAKAVCHPDRPDVKVVSSAMGVGGASERKDGLAWYKDEFSKSGLSNSQSGVDTLRHSYTLLFGLGMMESSGQYCVGRDKSADFSTADSAEAGLFQTSWGARVASPEMARLFEFYQSDTKGCLLDVFKSRVACKEWDAKTWGEGQGAEWQKLTKACPAFATEYAAVLMRTSGGSKGEFGPIRKKQAEVRLECDSMLSEVQKYVQSDPGVCAQLQ